MNTIYFFIKKITICLIFLGVQTIVVASDKAQPSCNGCITLTEQLKQSKQNAELAWKSQKEEKQKVETLEREKVLQFAKNHAEKSELEKLRLLKLDSETLETKREKLNGKEGALKLQKETLKQEQADLKQQIESHNAKGNSGTTSTCEKCDVYSLKLAENSVTIDAKDAKIAELQKLSQQAATTQKTNERLQEEIAGFQERANKSHNDITQLNNSVKTEQEKFKKLNQQLEEAVSAKINAEKLAEQRQQEITSLKEKLAATISQHKTVLNEQNASYQGKLDAQQALAITQKRQELNSLQESNQRLTEEIEALEKQRDAASEEHTQNSHFFGDVCKKLHLIFGNEEAIIDFGNLKNTITDLLSALLKQKKSLQQQDEALKQIPVLQASLLRYQIFSAGTAIVSLLMLLRMYTMQSGHA